jgi:hypothetical protein
MEIGSYEILSIASKRNVANLLPLSVDQCKRAQPGNISKVMDQCIAFAKDLMGSVGPRFGPVLADCGTSDAMPFATSGIPYVTRFLYLTLNFPKLLTR